MQKAKFKMKTETIQFCIVNSEFYILLCVSASLR